MNRLPHKIGVDLMGGDTSSVDLLKAVCEFATKTPQTVFYLIGTKEIQKYFSSQDNLFFVLAKQSIEMDENPLHAIRKKKDSSLCIGMHLLKKRKIDAFISSGNTGALVASAKTTLKMQPHILRPALLAMMPTSKTPLAVLDVGANIHVKAIHLVQFAQMGVSHVKHRVKVPKVGLLNIGAEKLKGTSILQEAFEKLGKLQESSSFIFVGNIEGKEVFQGAVDVLVTDGFTGNIFLKTAEGIATLILDRLKEKTSTKEFLSLTSYLDDLQKHLHYAEYPGAILSGVNGLVVKCHGYSSAKAFIKGIDTIIKNHFNEGSCIIEPPHS